MQSELIELYEHALKRIQQAKAMKNSAEEKGNKEEAVAWSHTFLAYQDMCKQIGRLRTGVGRG